MYSPSVAASAAEDTVTRSSLGDPRTGENNTTVKRLPLWLRIEVRFRRYTWPKAEAYDMIQGMRNIVVRIIPGAVPQDK